MSGWGSDGRGNHGGVGLRPEGRLDCRDADTKGVHLGVRW